ncbi:MAG: hypothetical protein LLG06_05145 [Desulfobacteraceae bacterium]|nr:hypothetical protein [Desulfobacteraceae bacterium]
MKRWTVLVLFSVLLGCPPALWAADDITHSGKAKLLSYPLIKVPFGGGGESKSEGEKKEGEAKGDDEREKIMDKKVDDAIKKAWGKE